MGRAPCCEKIGLKKGRWSAEEDDKLRSYIQAKGHGSWRSVPKNAGLLRCGKSCRLRWINYLRSDVKRGPFSEEEDQIIINLHATLGNKWSEIATQLPGRTDNEVKNYWNSHLSRKFHRVSGGVVPLVTLNIGNNIGTHADIRADDHQAQKKRRGRVCRANMKKKNVVFMRRIRAPAPLPQDDQKYLENIVNKDINDQLLTKMVLKDIDDDDDELSRIWDVDINVNIGDHGLLNTLITEQQQQMIIDADQVDHDPIQGYNSNDIHDNIPNIMNDPSPPLAAHDSFFNCLEDDSSFNHSNYIYNNFNWSTGINGPDFEDDQTFFSWLWDTTSSTTYNHHHHP